MSKFKNMKFHIKDEATSARVQQELFKMGYKWSGTSTKPQYLSYPYLFTDAFGYITYSSSSYHFKEHKNTEMIITEVVTTTVTFKESPEQFVEFNGKKYSKSKLEQALKALEQSEED